MPIIAQFLFGSHARGDFHESSDIDLLAVLSQENQSTKSIGRLNVSYYDGEHLLKEAAWGSLFVMHIVREAKLIYDSSNFHPLLVKAFVYREDYELEISRASDLGWFLALHSDQFGNHALLSRRISWVVRTILIAKSANLGSPTFSPASLLSITSFKKTDMLLALKSEAMVPAEIQFSFKSFLMSEGRACPLEIKSGRFTDAWHYFQSTKNSFALKTIAMTGFDPTTEIYI